MKFISADGRPVIAAHRKAYMAAMGDNFDKLEARLGKFSKENAEQFQMELKEADAGLETQYPNIHENEWPKTQAEAEKLLQFYGAPLTFLRGCFFKKAEESTTTEAIEKNLESAELSEEAKKLAEAQKKLAEENQSIEEFICIVQCNHEHQET